MYADRVEAGTNRSVKERLNGNAAGDSGRGEQRQDDDKWEHDLYENDESQISNRRVGAKDLRLKLQKKNAEQATRSVRGSVRDLREKLSGIAYSQPVSTDPPRPKPMLEGHNFVRKSVTVEAPVPETKKIASSVTKKKTQQKAEISELSCLC
ncbi:unnamed protein product [Ilex paraguariensis]|uniref:Uncharacterized protein n=1 Tax=Ilex paraguariensis TaxID=185542 RepID=A0ABC8SI72_9AQUA